MTTPNRTPPEKGPPPQAPAEVGPPPTEAPPDEDSALIPALLVAYAAYLLWRGSHPGIPTGWRQVELVLGLRRLIGSQLAFVSARALSWQRSQAGRAGDELLSFVELGVDAGIDAGIQAVAQALIWTDGHAADIPSTKDAGDPGPGEARVPTATRPPELLAQMTALAASNAAMFRVALAAGWAKKTWRSMGDDRVRHTHVALDGTTALLTAAFRSPSGAKLRFPGDPRAPIAETANCRCFLRYMRK